MPTDKVTSLATGLKIEEETGRSHRATYRVLGKLALLFLATGIAACSGSSGGGTPRPKTLTALTVTPASASIAVGATLQLHAIGTFSDNSTQDLTASVTWTSTDVSIAQVGDASANKGTVTGVKVGAATISASSGAIHGSAMVTIVPPGRELTAISIDPVNPSIADGTSIKLYATGIFSDNTTQNVTTLVVWASGNTAIATVGNSSGNKGLATAKDVGKTTIFATLGGVQGSTRLTVTAATLTSITIDPSSASIAKGTKIQLKAIGDFSDGTTQDLTLSASWASDDTGIATVNNANGTKGDVTGVDLGTVTISATQDGITGVSAITVTAATLTSITISPVEPSIAKGTKVQLTATGTFSDGTTQDLSQTATWSSLQESIASVGNIDGTKGLVTGLEVGTAHIRAEQAGIHGSTTVTVTAAQLIAITIDPPDSTIAKGTSIQLTATGDFTDGTTEDITTQASWITADESVAHVGNGPGTKGLVTGIAVGGTVIRAVLEGIEGIASVTVSAATLTSITVAPVNPTIAKGTTVQLSATGHFSDSSTENLTNEASWTSDNESIAQVSEQGLVTGLGVGGAGITASFNGVDGSTTVTVTSATLSSITIAPVNPSIAKGTAVQLIATGHFSDATTEDLTIEVSWTSADNSVAQVSDATATKGLVTGVAVGSASITATLSGVQGSTTVTVTAATLAFIEILPANPTLSVGDTLQFTAVGHFSDGTTQDLTALCDWQSSNPTVAHVISSSSHTNGRLLARKVGTTTITATFDGLQGSTLVAVTP